MVGQDSRGHAVRRLPQPGTQAGAGTSHPPMPPTDPVAARPVVSGLLSEWHVRAACHQRSRTRLASPSRQAANSLPASSNPNRLQPVSAKTAATIDAASCAARAAPCPTGRHQPRHAGAARRGQLPGRADSSEHAGAGQQGADPVARAGQLLLAGRSGFLLARYEVGGSPRCRETAGAASSCHGQLVCLPRPMTTAGGREPAAQMGLCGRTQSAVASSLPEPPHHLRKGMSMT